ncbi:uncharacterized protein (DUF885 family) [Tahibacter aquaticus]|uniref:Uncharacterized protein (DUF885 family) n=1 Tax=Tahibacter aquaticus TaxID=520092 RepID=A0A4R6YNB8_9GAMM|nr:DUF885 domain-containing protein [Tahibacter aquaticus]TDR38993.1 uncharacterized protein (DUF885 family) [Tahibacter aquaticus]
MHRTRFALPLRSIAVALGSALLLSACATSPSHKSGKEAAAAKPDYSAAVNGLADRYVAAVIDFDPTVTYMTGVPVPSHDRLPRNSADEIAAFAAVEDELLAELAKVDGASLRGTPAATTYAVLRESLEASKGLRICHQERWSLSHMGGWQLGFAEVADNQPVDTPEARAEAIARWSSLPGYIDNDMANLRQGLATGYAVPKSVLARVLKQFDGMIAAKAEDSPFYAPAKRSDDKEFKAAMKKLVNEQIKPALKKYRDFLVKEYKPKARDTLALSALPDGAACYQAQLRYFTTLDRTPQQVFDLGKQTVEANEATVADLGEKLFKTRDIKSIIAKVDKAKDNHFKSEKELLEFSRGGLDRAKNLSSALFEQMPEQPAVVEPMPAYQRGSGISAHYIPSADPSKPGEYRIPLETWKKETKGGAEITLVHETWPGHHLQIALANGLPARHLINKLSFNSAYLEGWGRYSERLAEEAGIYETEYAKISRRIWPARGMVVDPGIHMFGWTRKQAIAYIIATGRFDPTTAEATVDRIAVMPGQLTSYDSGGLEIFALRQEAEQRLGDKFDVRQFHSRVLENGVLPLAALRENVEAWITANGGAPAAQ